MTKKNPTIRDVLITVGGVKENTEQILEAIGIFSNNVEGKFGRIDKRFDSLEKDVQELKREMAALKSSVNNYLELSDKRYLELRQTNKIIFKYLKLVVDKSKISVDLSELEELVS